MNFLKWLLWWQHKKIDRTNTTKHFQDFKEYYMQENEEKGAYDSYNNFLVKYIVKTKLSPFIGDDDLREAKKFLTEQRITKKII